MTIKVRRASDDIHVVDFQRVAPNGIATVIVFDDQFNVVADYADSYDLCAADAMTPFEHNVYRGAFRGFEMAIVAIVMLLRDEPMVGRVVLSDLPHGGKDWESQFRAAQCHAVEKSEIYVLFDAADEGRKGTNSSSSLMDDGISYAVAAIGMLALMGIKHPRRALFTAGIATAELAGGAALNGVPEINKNKAHIRNAFENWWLLAKRVISSVFFRDHTRNNALHYPLSAYGILLKNKSQAIIRQQALLDFFGVWLWIHNLASRYDKVQREIMCYAYLCAKVYLYNGGHFQDGESGVNSVDYVALRALVCGMPFALARDLGHSTGSAVSPDSEFDREAIIPAVDRSEDGPWGFVLLADGATFQAFAEALFDFLFNAGQPGEGASRLGRMTLKRMEHQAELRLVFDGLLPESVFAGTGEGAVTKAWRSLQRCVSEAKYSFDLGQDTSVWIVFPTTPDEELVS